MQLVIAVKREHRKDAPENWLEQVMAQPGVEPVGEPLFGRLLVDVSDEAAQALRDNLGEYLLIEPVIRHQTSDPDGEPGSDDTPECE